MTNLITAPFAWVMRLFFELTGSYGIALILFSLVWSLILSVILYVVTTWVMNRKLNLP